MDNNFKKKSIEEATNLFLEDCKQRKLNHNTIRAYRLDLKYFLKLATSADVLYLSDITEDFVINICFDWQKKMKNATAYRKIASLKSFFHFLKLNEYIDYDFLKTFSVKRDKLDTPDVVSLENIRKIQINLEDIWKSTQKRESLRNLVIFEMLIYSGGRISEITALELEDIVFMNDLYIIQFKGDKTRNVSVIGENETEHFKNYINLYYSEIYEVKKLFINRDGKPLSEQSMRRIIQKQADLLEINMPVTPKILRNTLASNIAKSTSDQKKLQSFLGDKSFQTTERHLARNTPKTVHTIETNLYYN